MAKIDQMKVPKTVALFSGANLACSLVACADGRVGFIGALIMNSWLIYQLHELGKSRRPGANLVVQGTDVVSRLSQGLFGKKAEKAIQDDKLDNAVRNVCNGGAAMFDSICATLSPSHRN